MVKHPAPGATHMQRFLKQMLQLHSVTEVSSGILMLNLNAPQWQLPLYVLSSVVGIDSVIDGEFSG
jgi:hypothetical protein